MLPTCRPERLLWRFRQLSVLLDASLHLLCFPCSRGCMTGEASVRMPHNQITLINHTNAMRHVKPVDAPLPERDAPALDHQAGTRKRRGIGRMKIDLSGGVAVITGVGKGIGRELVMTLAREGMTTISLDVNQADLDSVAAELEASGAASRQYNCDIRDGERIRGIIEEVTAEFGRIDLLVNNAGVAGNGDVATLPEEVWDFAHDVNLKGTFLMCQAVLPIMKAQGRGRIVNAASFAAIVPSIGSAAYASSKAAVAHFTRALAGEVGPWNITANAYAPGMIPTTLNHFTELPHDQQERLLDTLSLREWGEKEDIANLVCFLASDAARYITGTLIDISGGKLATQVPRAAYEMAAADGHYEFQPEKWDARV